MVRGRRCLPVLLAAVLLVPLALTGPGLAQEDWRGRPLTEVLELLRERGLRIIYSSDLVHDELVVGVDPPPGSLYETLQSVLEPHGLTTEVGPAGTLLVVRRRVHRPLSLSLEQPGPDTVAVGDLVIEARVSGDEPVERVDFYVDGRRVRSLERPPFRVVTPVGDETSARTVRVVARGENGGVAERSVTTRRIELREEVEVALKQIYVTATRRGVPVDDLGKHAFVLLEDGQRRPLVTFEQGHLPLTAAILLDASESMRGSRLDTAVRGVRAFVARMERLDEATVFLFTDRPHQVAPFGAPPGDLLTEIEDLRAEGGTALHDALYVALRTLDDRLGRRVVVLLSDGADVSSVLSMEDVLWKLRRTDTQIYWIRLQTGGRIQDTISSSWRDAEGHRRATALLVEAVEESGGRVVALEEVGEVDVVLQGILQELRGQYALGYYPAARALDGSWRPVEVRVEVPGIELRYRSGYIDR